jgi:HEAT repeat protein
MKLEKLCCPSCGAPLMGNFTPNQQIECNSCGTPLLLTHLDSENPIFCPHCRTLNADEMRFCVNCGHKLKTDCVLCYTENRVDAVYCARCGAHLERARARRRKLEETRRKLVRERSQALEIKAARQKQEKLERLLADLDEPENHDFAIFQINQMGAEAVEALTDTLLHDQDPDARYGSARALGQIYIEKEIKTLVKARTVKALIQSLVDPEPAVRFWAAEALGKCKSQTAIKPLAELLRDPHEGVRQQAALSLEKIGGKQVREILQRSQSRGFLKWLRGN